MSNWDAIVEGCWNGARVAEETPLAGDASTRRYVRLRLEGGGAPAGAVGMILPGRTAPGEPELPFTDVQRHLAARGIAVPEIYASRDRDLGLLLLEDLGDRPLAAVLSDPATSTAESRRLLSDVVELLAGFVTSPADPRCVAYARSHDEALIRRELALVHSHGLAPSDDGPARPATADPEARATLARLGDALAAQPRRLIHRDFHAWNLHVDANGRLRVIDFQDAMLGPPTYDLASFCTDRDSDRFVDIDRECELLEGYRAALARRGSDLYRDASVMRRDYFTAVVFRTLRVIGRFRFLAIENGDARYLRYLPRMGRQTRRALEALGNDDLAGMLAERNAHFA